MHELSLCRAILNQALKSAPEAVKQIVQVDVLMGSLVKADVYAMQVNFSAVAKGSIAEGALLIIHEIEAKAHCETCQCDFAVAHLTSMCPRCQQHNWTLLQGMEMKLSSMEVE